MAFILQRLSEDRPVLSVEFFPPKNAEAEQQFLRAADKIRELGTDFASITYGAGGTTRERTLRYARQLQEEMGYAVMPHLTCVGHSREELHAILREFEKVGYPAIMALRGDPPRGETEFKPHPDGLAFGSDLVAMIRESYPSFAIGVGGYPETHPEAPDAATDLRNLGIKLDAGGDFVTTQLFLDNRIYFHYVAAVRSAGYTQPILPGVIIALDLEQLRRFAGFCQASIPRELEARLEAVDGDADASAAIGYDWAESQCLELLNNGAPGIHLYILNRANPAIELVKRLRKKVSLGTV